MTTTEVVLVRHARTPWHQENRYTGRTDLGLDDIGEQQAQHLAAWVVAHRRPDLLVCTPLARSRDTAAPIATATGLTPRWVPALREIDFGLAEGRTLAELQSSESQRAAEFLARPASRPWPGGDDPIIRTDAATRALAELAHEVPGGRVLAVSHSTLIRLLVCAVLGVPLDDYRRRFPVIGPCAAVVLRSAGPQAAGWALTHYNLPTEG
jgi:probable phosphoglycerate mutase